MNQHVSEVCKSEGGKERCRYLVNNQMGCFECHNLWPKGRRKIDTLIREGIRQFKSANCKGQTYKFLNT